MIKKNDNKSKKTLFQLLKLISLIFQIKKRKKINLKISARN